MHQFSWRAEQLRPAGRRAFEVLLPIFDFRFETARPESPANFGEVLPPELNDDLDDVLPGDGLTDND